MATIKKGLMSGEELLENYSSANKKKIYFYSGISKCQGLGQEIHI